MATSLGKVGIVDRGNYSSEVTYNSGDFVFYEGSTWLALKDGLTGIKPVDGENWKYLARGVPENIQDEIDSIKNNKLDKTEFDNLQIGGRNLARGTSSEYTKEITHSGGTSVITSLGNVYTNGLKVGDTLTVRLLYKYSNLVFETDSARFVLQGSGNVTGWGAGSFSPKSVNFTTESDGEYELLYSFKVTEDHLKNEFWRIRLRHDYIASGTSTWKMLKVEKGTKPTDWTPAPEDIQDQINNVQNPTFDDSGTAEGINSFADFMNSVKSKMNIFQFFKNFKAGMKYVLHTGRLVNNAVTTEEGFALDARMGKTLQDQITEQNKNISGIFKSDNNTVADADNCIPGFNAINNTSTSNSHYTSGWSSILHLTNAGDGYNQQLLFPWSKSKKMAYRVKENNTWNDWSELVTNSDFKRTIEIRLPYIALGGKLYASYAFPVRLDSIPNVTLDDYSIDGIGQVDSFRNYLVNQEEVIFEFTKSDMNFELGKCYIGRTRFTIS